MEALNETVFAWVAAYGPLALFGLLVLGIIGLPVPDEILLTYAGFLCSRGRIALPATMIAGLAGSVVGITASYGIGRLLGSERVERVIARLGIAVEHLDRVRAWFERRGKWVLVFGYFVPGVRHFTAIVAGTSHLPGSTFARYAYAGALIWSQGFLMLGYLLGESWRRAAEAAQSGALAMTCAAAAVGVVIYVIRRRRRGASGTENS